MVVKAKKRLEKLVQLPYKMEISPDLDEGGYVISFPELPGCLTCGETIEQALKNAEDAKQEWYIAQMDD